MIRTIHDSYAELLQEEAEENLRRFERMTRRKGGSSDKKK